MTVRRLSDKGSTLAGALRAQNVSNYAIGKTERNATLNSVKMAGRKSDCDNSSFSCWGLSPIDERSRRTRPQRAELEEQRPAPRADLQEMQDTTNTQTGESSKHCELVKGGEPSQNLGSPPKTAGRQYAKLSVVSWSHPIKYTQLRRKKEDRGTCTQLKNIGFALDRLTTGGKTRRLPAVSSGEPPSPHGSDRVHHPTNPRVIADV